MLGIAALMWVVLHSHNDARSINHSLYITPFNVIRRTFWFHPRCSQYSGGKSSQRSRSPGLSVSETDGRQTKLALNVESKSANINESHLDLFMFAIHKRAQLEERGRITVILIKH